jgi:uncharacterized protein (DUF362 family)/Pyruvate/2-oxoacid:ferredoxin oxidoreductase delta subunit
VSRVAVVGCSSYETAAVQAALDRGLSLLGGVEQFARAGETILLKPNLLIGRDADRAVTTHPDVFRAAAVALRRSGARVVYGDSPAFGSTEWAAGRAGIARVAKELDVPPADFATPVTVPYPSGDLIKQFTIARGVWEADGIVSLCKMKTHGLTRITGAIKNQYGCIPGLLKAEFHARLANAALFSRMLVDLNGLLRPRLFILDGVVAMEGNGPQGGTLRAMGVLLLSTDPVALDAAFCRLANLDPRLVLPIVYGEAAGLGSARDIDYVGDPVDAFVAKDFVVNRRALSTTGTTPHYGRGIQAFRRLVVPRPVVRSARCTKCGTCVTICPVQPKAVEFRDSSRSSPPVHRYARCIRCYCCQETCPESAIEIATPLLGRLIRRGS